MIELHDPALFHEQCFFDGAWRDSADGSAIGVENPCSGETLGTVPRLTAGDMRLAIAAAQDSFSGWRSLAPAERGRFLLRWHELIMENKQDLARILTSEQGKPLAESLGEIALGSSYVPWYAEECRRAYGDVIPPPRSGVRPVTFRQPVGVVLAITPWNFPFSMITRKAAPALAAGCPVIVKPASATPFSALALAELAARAGFPKGVFSVVTGASDVIAQTAAESREVRKISFTGSTEVGRRLMEQAAVTVKRTSMELGGNAPFIVFDDADLETAVNGAFASKMRNSGQTCISSNRMLVQKGIASAFVEALAERFRGVRLGDGMDPATTAGPLINEKAVGHCEALVQDAVGKGARLVLGGRRSAAGKNFFEPTILTGLTTEMRMFHEEIFGPVAPVMVFEREEEAVRLANATQYGLASYVFTRDLSRAWRVPEALEYGLCGVNDAGLAMAEVPFGGVKASGTGREGGHEGLDDFLETRYVLMGGIS